MDRYPLKLSAHVRGYDVGERLIPDLLGKTGAPEGKVSETWEISDYRDTTGIVTNGQLAGRTLHDLTLQYPGELVGQAWHGPYFPILEKFIDASARGVSSTSPSGPGAARRREPLHRRLRGTIFRFGALDAGRGAHGERPGAVLPHALQRGRPGSP